jgi:PAS domain S-box-containing protein
MPHTQDPTTPEASTETVRETLQDYALITMNPQGEIVQWSDGAEKVFGYKADDIVGRSFAILFTPEDQEAGRPDTELSVAAGGKMSEDERWHMRNDGSRIWVTGTVRALTDENGEVTGFAKLARDITSKKLLDLQRDRQLASEQMAREEAERRWKNLEEISENIPALIALLRLPDQIYIFANRMYREALGNSGLFGLKLRDAHPQLGEDIFATVDAAAESGEPFRASERLLFDRYYDFVLQPMRSEAAQYEGLLVFAVDVSERVATRHAAEGLTEALKSEREQLKAEIAERKRAETLAQKRSELLKEQAALLNLAHDAIMAVRFDTSIEIWNRGAEETYGWTEREAVGKPVHELLQTTSPIPLEQIRQKVIEEGQWTGELGHTRRNGEKIDVSSRWVLWKSDGKPQGWLEINRDITERKRMESHLRDTQKMESLGVLAGGIAHDFNNLLTGIMGNVSLALEMLEASSPVRQMLSNSLRASEQAAFLTKQILAYAGKGQLLVQAVDLSRVVHDSLSLVNSSIPRSVHMDLELSKPLPAVTADATQLQQVAMNLIFNAAEAIGDGPGKIVVRTSAHEVAPNQESIPSDVGVLHPGLYAVLEVQDTGPGIEPPVRSKIFDPFFTTKFTGRGLGLAAVAGIVRALHGAVSVESTAGGGTTFRVMLPAGSPFEVQTKPHEPILVVDDEEIVRTTARAMLLSRGYQVLLAEDGQQALESFGERKGEIALVLLDMAMPLMSGEETLRALKSLRPDLPVVVSSGYSEREAIRRFGGLGVAGFLQKPYTVHALLDKVAAVTNRNGGQPPGDSPIASGDEAPHRSI